MIDALPVWAAAALLFVALVATGEIGARIHASRGDDDSQEEGYLVSAALGLLALLLGFTFSLALDRYEQRRELVVAEANAIGTAWLRTDLLPPASATPLRELLRDYTDARIALADAGEDDAAIVAADTRAAALQARIWRIAVPAARAEPSAPLGNAMLAGLTEVFDLAGERHAALRARIPTRAVSVLALYALITAGILGYAMQRGRLRHRGATTALFALLALTVGLILDLDRPRSGAIVVDQAPLTEVRATMGGA